MPGAREKQAAPRRTQQERSDTTSADILAAARFLFARRGYAGTSLDAVVERCQMTKGALYHHFPSKQDLFEAVFEDEERRLAARVATAQRAKRDPMASALAGISAMLDASVDAQVQRVLFLDGPAVLGWDRIRAIEQRHSLSLLSEAVAELLTPDAPRSHEIEAACHLLYGALLEAALLIAESKDPNRTRRDCERTLKRFLNALTI